MEAEAQALLEELRAAQEEHESALTAANEVCNTLNHAKKEYEDACATEKAREEELSTAAEALAVSLQSLEVEGNTAKLELIGPLITASLVEYHANIGCYQCYLFLDSHGEGGETTARFDAAKLAVRVEFPRVEIVTKRKIGGEDAEDVQVVWWAEIERNVDVLQCTLEDKNDHWYLRLPIKPSDKQPLGGFSSFTQVSPDELRPESYGSVSCRGCNALLLGDEGSKIEKVLPLPSANWMDMFDFWGAGIGAFEHIPRDDIHAQQHRALVGESYVLLHASDFVKDATLVDMAPVVSGDNEKEEREWMPLNCAACSNRVGLCSVEQPGTVRLHKHLISARCRLEEGNKTGQECQEENVFSKYTIDSILSAKLLEMADSDGKFRFVLTPSCHNHEDDLSSGKRGEFPTGDVSSTELQLQLLSWETMIKRQGEDKFRRVLKVLYGPKQPMPAIPGLLPSEEVSLPPTMCSAIAQRLELSTRLLPVSLRTFNRMNMGYLFA
ncbi:hypothetical protein P3T76_005040 [Phytophthora citrophthora]|uniref:HECT domain-containing protein n=1 Tax=Phytophthora citrophthora TaxID=4793 RepID=A0AAD9LR03_9STRA|nr:hypothetical protein P3T76_005040 [Phytophthora citrophthora]